MASYICGLSLFSAFLSFLVASISEYYEANLEFDNKVPTLEPMHRKYAESSVICAMLCGSGCKCFNFNENTRMCQSYNSCNILDITVNEIGWRFYVKRSLSRNGDKIDYIFEKVQKIDTQLYNSDRAEPWTFQQRCLDENKTYTADARVFQHRCLYESQSTYHEDNVTKSQYCFIKSPFNWTNAKGKCQSFRSHLLEINTESEQNWLNEKVYGDKWWTGGVMDENGIDWIWGNSSSEMVFTNWATSQPESSTVEDCVVITSSGRWHDYKCLRNFYVICEIG